MMNLNKGVLSIIIVNYNNSEGLEITLRSIERDLCAFIEKGAAEVVIIDGASSDSSKSVIENYNGIVSKVISEPDDGIYYAMNKGINIATFNYLYFLNTGDVLNATTFEPLFSVLALNEHDFVWGKVNAHDKNGLYIRTIGEDEINLAKFKNRMPVCHQSCFFKRDLMLHYDTSFRVISDKDFIFRAIRKAKKLKFLDLVVMDYYRNGFSTLNSLKWKRENISFLIKHFGLDINLPYYLVSYFYSLIIERVKRCISL